MKNIRLSAQLWFVVLVLFLGVRVNAATNEIKFAVLAPEGSTWVNLLKEMDKELRSSSGDRLGLRIYPGGVSGDERDVLRKIRIGQIHASGLTGVGLGDVVSSIRVLELPLLFKNEQEEDYVKSKLKKEFEAEFEQKGFVLLGWSGAGFVNIFSNKPIRTRADMSGTKWWAWSGDPLVKEMYDTLGIVPIALPLPDVLTSLQTNLIDAVYAPPVAAIALQWFTKTKYMTELSFANSTGGMIISKVQFEKLSPDLKLLLKTTAEKYSNRLVEAIRQENIRSIETLKKNGIQIVQVAPADFAELEKSALQVRPKMIGKLYSKELLDRVEGLILEYRKSHGN